MKSKLFLFAAVFLIAIRSYATVHMIMVADYQFSPASGVTVHPGDTVMWMWVNDTHTTTSTIIPPTATPWDKTLNSANTSFIYVPTVVGVYNYQCNIHVSMGMTGSFTVVSAAGVQQISTASVFNVFPNPVAVALHIQCAQPGLPLSVMITDINGKEMLSKKYSALEQTNLNVENIPDGTYYIRAEQSGNVYTQQLLIEH